LITYQKRRVSGVLSFGCVRATSSIAAMFQTLRIADNRILFAETIVDFI